MVEVRQAWTLEGMDRRVSTVRQQIEAACQRCGRSSGEVTLIGVTKTFPQAAVAAARGAGVVHFGENRPQELATKAEAMPGAHQGGGVTWHMIGSLQRNKAKLIAAHADVFHALDSLRLAEALERALEGRQRRLPCFVQVNISGEATKGGFTPEDVSPFLAQLSAFPHIEPVGLMGMAAPAHDPEEIRPQFRILRTLRDRCQANTPGRLPYLSMGMSSDYVVAIEEGATHVRIGSALFGNR